MNTADTKSVEARLADLEDRMENVVSASLMLTDAVELMNNVLRDIVIRVESLRKSGIQMNKAMTSMLEVVRGR